MKENAEILLSSSFSKLPAAMSHCSQKYSWRGINTPLVAFTVLSCSGPLWSQNLDLWSILRIPRDLQTPMEKFCCYCNISDWNKSTFSAFIHDEFIPLSCKYAALILNFTSGIYYSQVKLTSLLMSYPIPSAEKQKERKKTQQDKAFLSGLIEVPRKHVVNFRHELEFPACV